MRARTLWLAVALVALLFVVPALAAPPAATRVQPLGTVALASAARTATASSAWYTLLPTYSGIVIVVDTTADPGTASVTLSVQVWDIGKDAAITYQSIGTPIAATGTLKFGVWSGGTTAGGAGLDEAKQSPLPGFFRITMTAADAQSITYSVTVYPVK